MPDCIFCEIVNKRMKSEMIHEDEELVAFKDINPQAPVHVLVVPRKHIDSVNVVTLDDMILMGKLVLVAKEIAEKNNIDGDGYRLVINNGVNGGQTVPHLHLHILGGRRMTWPPG